MPSTPSTRKMWALFAALLAQQQGHARAASCCDANPKLCKPLSPQPVYEHEVVAYHAPGDYGGQQDSWKHYDFTKITAIGLFGPLTDNLLCKAHAHGVRLLDWQNCNGINGGPGTPAGFPTQLNPFNEPWMLLNASLIAEYVKFSTACVVRHGFDGMTLDIENMPWPLSVNGTTNSTTDAVRSGLTDLVCALKAALAYAIPGSTLTFTTDGDAAFSAVGYDYAALSVCCDYFMPMVYSSCNNTRMSDADEKGAAGWEAARCEYTASGNSLSTVRLAPPLPHSSFPFLLHWQRQSIDHIMHHCSSNGSSDGAGCRDRAHDGGVHRALRGSALQAGPAAKL